MRSVWLLPFREVGHDVRVTGCVLVRGRGAIIAHDRVWFDSEDLAIELHAIEGATIEIAEGAYIGPGVSIEATGEVFIGKDAHIEPLVKILDNNWHGTAKDRESLPDAVPVVVGEGARIGERSILLPGASIGPRTQLLPDSVLSRRTPAGAVVGGVPARAVRQSR